MLSTIIKIFCVVVTVFASSTTGQQLGNWDIVFQSLETDFQDSLADEITLTYQVGGGRNFNVELLEKNCAMAIFSDETVAPTTTIARTTSVTAEHDGVEIKLDLDKSTMTSLDIWEDGKLQFCVRVRLLSGDSIIKEE